MLPRVIFASSIFWLMTLPSVAGANGTTDMLHSLLSNSPFGRPETSSPASPAQEQPIEFRGLLMENGTRLFSLFQISSRRSLWVKLNDPMSGLTVTAYDEEHTSVTVDYQGRSLTLALKRSRAQAQVTLPAVSGIEKPEITTAGNPRYNPEVMRQYQEERRLGRKQKAATTAEPAAANRH